MPGGANSSLGPDRSQPMGLSELFGRNGQSLTDQVWFSPVLEAATCPSDHHRPETLNGGRVHRGALLLRIRHALLPPYPFRRTNRTSVSGCQIPPFRHLEHYLK